MDGFLEYHKTICYSDTCPAFKSYFITKKYLKKIR